MPPILQSLAQHAPFLQPPLRFGWRFTERWNADNCPLMAAALAFYGLLSVFPLALAGVAIMARFLSGDAGAMRDFASFVASFFPGAAGAGIETAIENAVHSLAGGPSPTTAGLLALGSLLWSARAYFDTLATVLNGIFPGSAPRSFLGQQLALWGLIVGVGALFLLSSGVTFGLSLAQTLAARLPQLFINRAPIFWNLAGKFAGIALTFAMFTLLYRYTPNRQTPPRRRPILVGALVASLGWEVAKWAFGRFLGNVTRYEATYGGVAGVVVTMTWLYFSSLLILAGAQVGATWEEIIAPQTAPQSAPPATPTTGAAPS